MIGPPRCGSWNVQRGELKPVKLYETMAFMVESAGVLATRFARPRATRLYCPGPISKAICLTHMTDETLRAPSW